MDVGSRFGVIGGSGVQIKQENSWCVKTPFGRCLVSALDPDKRVLFASRHLSTSFDEDTDKPKYAPPHEVNYRAIIWALVVESGCTGIVAFGSTGSLDPAKIPVGSVVMPDDYYMVVPDSTTFWGNDRIGSFSAPDGGIGRIHYTPASVEDAPWLRLRRRVQAAVRPLLAELAPRMQLAQGQTPELWPMAFGDVPGDELANSMVYVNTCGPRFETRAEIRSYRSVGHVVGMTCGREWALSEELRAPYCLICVCDNACNGLSNYPGGALQEYMDHKQAIADVTGGIMAALVADLQKTEAAEPAATAA